MELTQEALKERVSYDPETGHFIRLRAANKRWRALEGQRAGAVRDRHLENSYRLIYVGGRGHYEHRLAWFYVYGEWPAEIDHINGDKGDNRLANLRPATRAQNQWNVKRARASSGFIGVRLHRPSGLWQAYINSGGVFRSLGYASTPAAASALREAASQQAHGDFHHAARRSD